MRKLRFILCIIVFVLLPLCLYATEPESTKKKITNIDEIPRHTYEITGSLTELITETEAFIPFALEVRKDIENDLEIYEFDDNKTLRDFYRILLRLDMLEGNYDAATLKNEMIRNLHEKTADKLVSGLVYESIIKAQREVGVNNETAYKKSFIKHFVGTIKELPWDIVKERVEEMKGSQEMLSENFLLGVLESQYGQAAYETGRISGDIARQAISAHYHIKIQLPLKEEIIQVYKEYIDSNKVEKPDIWEERNVDLSDEKDLTSVVIAIWDSGVDISIFSNQLFINPNEKLNDRDDDGNGYVDDIHGIAYTFEEEKTPELLYPLVNAKERFSELKEIVKGLFDLMAGLETPEVQSLRKKLASMNPEDVKPFMEDLAEFANYNHGTNTAGIAVDGNPAARILVARLTIDHKIPPPAPTIERAYKTAKSYREVVKYFKENKVRVVNMSWGGTLRGTEEDLEANGIGKDAKERAKLAREIFDIEKEALYDAMKNAPEILFVNAAGNENDDVSFEDYYPASFDLPNVLSVGAVDRAGDVTSFTSSGKQVSVYANGYEVEGFLVGGDKISISGTSISSPQVANLAAKLIAIEPSLIVNGVVDLIKKGANRSEDGELLLINPKRSVEFLISRKDINN